MTDAREQELLRAVPTLACRGEIEGFRQHLKETGETPTGPVVAALLQRERERP